MRATSCVLLSLLAGCPDRTVAEVTPEQGRVETKDLPAKKKGIDILLRDATSGRSVSLCTIIPMCSCNLMNSYQSAGWSGLTMRSIQRKARGGHLSGDLAAALARRLPRSNSKLH